MKRIGSFLLAIATLAAIPVTPAYADDDDDRNIRSRVSEAQAVRIARGYGMVRVTEVERDDGGWEIEGRDRRGREVKVTINRLGRVTKVERGDDD
ncbi:PepSY domain-containing protein [Sphingopyxis sp. UBA6734]|uniref:PepSY domain-containing protein n=1 Tax=Sphingopyxis sp. UBA6734 TaxID=1947539 RepID=UPI0025E7646E|nr:PepSY domain-containing protein [Sphingopyxis sp. UBA6734]